MIAQKKKKENILLRYFTSVNIWIPKDVGWKEIFEVSCII